jgi:prolipoprotein diacylglyceryl transferase
MLAALPSPGTNTLSVGPLDLRLYGLMIALGVVAAVMFAERRWQRRGGDPKDISTIAVWAVPAGLVGARLYHLATDWRRYEGRWLDVFAVWQGGLGIPGGIIGGVPVPELMDVVAPAIPLGQAIGRLGNWFNQELFGRPTGLPWGLEIDPGNRPSGYGRVSTFHPTFLYEAFWNLGLIAVLLRIEQKARLRPGSLFWCYVLGYAGGRLWVEALRIDPASEVLGLRINLWTSLIAIAAALAVLVVRQRRGDRSPNPSPSPSAPSSPA